MKLLIITIVSSIIIGYLFGCINLSYFISKFKGFDIRNVGSGNAGASNVVIVIGKRAGLFIALFDIFKAFLAVTLVRYLFPNAMAGTANYAGVIAGVATIIGHIAPFYMGFKGGKGLASLGGTILALDARMFVVLFLLAIVIAVVTDYICFVPLSMSVIFPISYSLVNHSFVPAYIFSIATILMWYKHMINLQRIKEGTELKFHFLWNRGSEAERFGIEDDGKAILERDINEHKNIVK